MNWNAKKKGKQIRLTSWRIWSDLRDLWRGSANQSHWEVFYVRLPLRWELEELYASPFGSVDVNCEREKSSNFQGSVRNFFPKLTSQRHRMWLFGWANETRHAINALLFFAVTIFLLLLSQSHDWKRNETRTWKNNWWGDRVMTSLTFLFLFLCGKAKRHAVWKLASLGIKRESPDLKQLRHHKSSFSSRQVKNSPEDSWTCFLRCSSLDLVPSSGFSLSHHQPAASLANSRLEVPSALELARELSAVSVTLVQCLAVNLTIACWRLKQIRRDPMRVAGLQDIPILHPVNQKVKRLFYDFNRQLNFKKFSFFCLFKTWIFRVRTSYALALNFCSGSEQVLCPL